MVVSTPRGETIRGSVHARVPDIDQPICGESIMCLTGGTDRGVRSVGDR
jgi:hypothetical protein